VEGSSSRAVPVCASARCDRVARSALARISDPDPLRICIFVVPDLQSDLDPKFFFLLFSRKNTIPIF